MAGSPTTRDVRAWAEELDAVAVRLAPQFARREPRQRAIGYLRGLLSDAERKNGWQLAEELGDATPDGVQHLLARAAWDADGVRDDLIDYVAERIGHRDGVLVVDETGFLKKGDKSVGVARQSTGTAGPHRELPGRCLPRLRHADGPGPARPGTVPLQGVGR